MKPKVLVTRQIPEPGLNLLKARYEVSVNEKPRPMSRAELVAGLSGAAALLCMLHDRVDGMLLASAPTLKIVANMAVGVDNVDLDACSQRGIVVTNTPGVLTEATADLTFALLMAAARKIVQADRYVRDGCFKHWDPMLYLGADFCGKTIGIIGLGRIGKAVARRARGFGLQILYYNRQPLDAAEADALEARYAPLETVIREADFLALHLPYSAATHHLINRDRLNMMKPSAYLINTARGALVDEAALVECLKEKRIAGAALDVYEKEPALSPGLAELDSVVLAPHLGSASLQTRQQMAMLAAESIDAFLQGRKPRHLVNPAVIS